jgi:hypothetical protein
MWRNQTLLPSAQTYVWRCGVGQLLRISLILVSVAVALAVLFPWQNPPPQVEAIFALGIAGTVVSCGVLGWRRLNRRLHRL